MEPVRVRLAVLAVVIVAVAVGGGLAVAAATNGSDAAQASVAPHRGYCAAAVRALEYTGHDASHAADLLDRVVASAPADVAPTVRAVRAAAPGSDRSTAAHNVWDYFNNTHCCDCHQSAPPTEIREFTPEQRARVEAGGLP